MKMKATFLGIKGRNHINHVFNSRIMEKVRELTDLYDTIIDRPDLSKNAEKLKEIEIAFASWGVPAFTEIEIKTYLPNLKVLFYAAGTVQDFARPFLNCGIKVISGWGANAVPVAEYSASQIILANKGFYQCISKMKRDYRAARKYAESFPGNYDATVGLLGAGMVGKLVIEILKNCNLEIMVFDPFLDYEEADELGIIKGSLTEIFSRCQTISNHLANNTNTVGMLNRKYFNLMLPNATFINTGRGAQVVEQDLIDAMKAVPGRTAVLDVTWPEPPELGSELYELDNVFLTPHIAGSVTNEVERMAVYMLEELERYMNGEKLVYEVNLDMLKIMA